MSSLTLRVFVLACLTLWAALVNAADPPAAERGVERLAPEQRLLLQSLACLGTQRAEGVAGLVLLTGSPHPAAPDPFGRFLPPHRLRACALFLAAQVLDLSHPAGAYTLIGADRSYAAWQEAMHDPGQVAPAATPKSAKRKREIDPRADPVMLQNVTDRTEVLPAKVNWDEHSAYHYLIIHARDVGTFAPDALRKLARHDIFYIHMFEDAPRYRGEIVHLEGTLRRLIPLSTPDLENDGVKEIYEGWMYVGNNTLCVITSELPPGLEPGEKLNKQVTFDGYFFKRYRYPTAETDQNNHRVRRDAPLLVGYKLNLVESTFSSEATTLSGNVVASIMAIIGAVVALAVLLGWWFRRGDRMVHSRVMAARHATFIEPAADSGTADFPPTRLDAPEADN